MPDCEGLEFGTRDLVASGGSCRTRETQGEAFAQYERVGGGSVVVGPLRNEFDVDAEECRCATELVVLILSDDRVLQRGVDQPVQELSVSTVDLDRVESEGHGERGEQLTFLVGEAEVSNGPVEKVDVRGDVRRRVDPAGLGS